MTIQNEQFAQTDDLFTDLSDEEQAMLGGGGFWGDVWNDTKKFATGYGNYISGELDGATHQSSEQRDRPYRLGYKVGEAIDVGLATAAVVAAF